MKTIDKNKDYMRIELVTKEWHKVYHSATFDMDVWDKHDKSKPFEFWTVDSDKHILIQPNNFSAVIVSEWDKRYERIN